MYQITQPTDWAFYYVVSRRFLTVKDLFQTKVVAVGSVAMKQVSMSELGFFSASVPH
jgi:hypothetical protein